ncbi:MAG: S8 family peptidase [Candidatus Sericytochromatia bacterium]
MSVKKFFDFTVKLTVTLSFAYSMTACTRDIATTPIDSQQASSVNSNAVKGQYVLKFKQKIDTNSVIQMAKTANAEVIKFATRMNSAVIEFSQSPSEETLQTLRANSLVEFVEPNYKISNKYTMSDPRTRDQQGLAVAGLSKAWDITFGDPKIVIAVVDTGIDLKHPDLKNKVVEGYNVITQGKTPPMDDNGHGTHASGIAAAESNNKIGIAGVAPKCKLMPVKALDAKGSGDIFNVALGVIWAVDHGARVLNLSLGGPKNETLKRAVDYALAKNVVVVTAMGNDGKNSKAYPAAFPGVISVGAVDFDRKRADFSNYGDWISVAAPGVQIMSTMPTYKTTMTEMEKEQGYDYLDGTSMACPIVAGIAALVLSRNPDYTPAEVKERIQSTATDVGKKGYDIEYGYGVVNAAKAVL